ncbi:MATE family efflux transporter DinF [Rahnella sp. C60]|jgi:multidrug resistance protein, MATE family|uniref:MATE family efflux transporter DinF n=1 Tax=Rahnella perminowiae TaxID=2816244 RepID=UPI001C257BB1|nr:MATE family efflux transporter DinF [Rahnella perminowiae]MBU9813257.1 MATE family efflux transporter DinF [Rahnella perminowiae]MBU9817183.1 MATE family efflux transporter DinF [Rahnella perminowiae]MBU9827336.1 MATE family efflux transporter DinF [Rahnella perminowiae]MCR8999601.1 MATE family efflux transporter DinF [Rahnella perminowiae]
MQHHSLRQTLKNTFLSPADKALWRLALPMIFSNITVPLLGLVDTAVIGHLDSPDYLGGVAVGSMITTFLFMLLLFLRMSTTGMTAQALGANDNRLLARAFVQPFLLAVLSGLTIVLFRHPLMEQAFHIVGGSQPVLEQARLFIEIRWFSAPASLANLVILGWLLGIQYVRGPVILLIAGNLLNIILDLWLVMGLGWNVRGAAMATASSEYFTLFIGLYFVWRVMKQRGITGAQITSAWRGNLRRLLGLNRDIMLRSLLLQLCFASLTVLGARLGSHIVAVNAVLMNLLTFTAFALDGFAYAIEAHSGEAFGARNRQKLLDVWHAACRQAGLVALIFALIYALAGGAIIDALTSLPELRELADHYLGWQIILPLVAVWCYLLDGMFIGATRGRDMRNSMVVAAIGYGLTLFSLPLLGNHALWLALTVFLGMRGLSLGWIWRRYWRHDTWFSLHAD